MLNSIDSNIKILFRYESPILDQWVVETMWAKPIDVANGLYQINSIPFYGPLIASDDIVYAEYDNDEDCLTYRKTVEHSGNSIIAVVVMQNDVDTNDIIRIFQNLGCITEKLNDVYFSMEVNAKQDYKPIRNKLTELEDQGKISFSEPCLSAKHSY